MACVEPRPQQSRAYRPELCQDLRVPCRELRPKANTSGQASLDSEQRFMALAAWVKPAGKRRDSGLLSAPQQQQQQQSSTPVSSLSLSSGHAARAAQRSASTAQQCAPPVTGDHAGDSTVQAPHQYADGQPPHSSTGVHQGIALPHADDSAARGAVQARPTPGLPAESSCWVLAASSDACLQLLHLQLPSRMRFRSCQLVFHRYPVLCLQYLHGCFGLASSSGSGKIEASSCAAKKSTSIELAFSGGTDGSLAVWDLTHLPEQPSGSDGRHLQPELAVPRWHQSGVNALHARKLPGTALALGFNGDTALTLPGRSHAMHTSPHVIMLLSSVCCALGLTVIMRSACAVLAT